jgi:hypothetical protein
MEILFPIVFGGIIVGAILGFIWRWHINGLILAAACVGGIAGAISADWSEFTLMFSRLDAFIWIGFKYLVFFAFMMAPVIVSAIIVFALKRMPSKRSENIPPKL